MTDRRPDYPLRAAPVGSVTIDGGFWGPRITTNAAMTVPHNFRLLEGNEYLPNFDRAAVYSAVDRRQQVYWGTRIRGEDLALPKSWWLLYQDGADWRPVELQEDAAFTLRLDQPNEVRFKAVTTRALRLEVEFSGTPCGIQEWRVE